LTLIRILIGILFIVSGFEKLVHPVENFLFVIQSYDFVFSSAEIWVARVFPWLELFGGMFVLAGLWLRPSLLLLLTLNTSFIIVVASAIIRKLPIEECGCFGDLITIPIRYVLVLDLVLLALLAVLLLLCKRDRWSLDHVLEGKK
jgi:uncharacterized membrane protein YphA (DoxX/SURF4 family)